MRSWWVVGWFVVALLGLLWPCLLVSPVFTWVAMFYWVSKDVDVPYVPYVPHLFLFEMCSPTTSRFCHQRHTPSTKMVVDVLGGVCGFFLDARFHQCWVRLVAVMVSRAVGVHCLVAIAVLSWR